MNAPITPPATPVRIQALELVAQLARRVRQAQKEYFRVKTPESLRVSRDSQSRLDKAIAALNESGTLFGSGE